MVSLMKFNLHQKMTNKKLKYQMLLKKEMKLNKNKVSLQLVMIMQIKNILMMNQVMFQ